MRLLVKFQTPCAKNGASIRPGTKQAAQRWIAIQDQALRKLLVLFVILTGLFVGESRAQANAAGDTTIDTTTDTTGATSTMLGKTDSVTLAIGAVLQEMFWRVRANDNSVFYENEFPQLRESMNLDTYLQGVRFRRSRRPNSDSIIAITIDSARVTGDTAMAYVNLTILPLGSDTTHSKISGQRLYRLNGKWIRPLSTTPKQYEEYSRRIQRYEEDAEREDDR